MQQPPPPPPNLCPEPLGLVLPSTSPYTPLLWDGVLAGQGWKAGGVAVKTLERSPPPPTPGPNSERRRLPALEVHSVEWPQFTDPESWCDPTRKMRSDISALRGGQGAAAAGPAPPPRDHHQATEDHPWATRHATRPGWTVGTRSGRRGAPTCLPDLGATWPGPRVEPPSAQRGWCLGATLPSRARRLEDPRPAPGSLPGNPNTGL